MENKSITSTSNPLIKKIQLLQTKKSARKKEGLCVIEGLRGVNEIPKGQLKELIISEESLQLVHELVHNVPYITVPQTLYNQLSHTETPQGIMAVVAIQNRGLETIAQKENGFYLILEHVQDPGNLGTLIRTAYGFGVDGIILTKGCVDVYNPKTIRSTMGAFLHVPIVEDVQLDTLWEWVAMNNIKVFATDLQDSKPLQNCVFTGNIALVIGNEANGISEEMRQKATYKMRIPMPGGLESLNAAVAGAICLYEAMSQRNT